MPTPRIHVPADMTELLADPALSLEELARACRVAPDWVSGHVHDGLLEAVPTSSTETGWRFTCTTVVRARRLADLERQFDADPHLAALTVDLMEEVIELRRRVAG